MFMEKYKNMLLNMFLKMFLQNTCIFRKIKNNFKSKTQATLYIELGMKREVSRDNRVNIKIR